MQTVWLAFIGSRGNASFIVQRHRYPEQILLEVWYGQPSTKGTIIGRLAAETRLKNLEAEMQDREAAFDHKLREQVERTRSSSEAR